MERVCASNRYFVQRTNAVGNLGLSSRQRITVALSMLTLGVCVDALDEYCKIIEGTAMECLKMFCVAICA
jgi:hypothetical protein